MQIMEKNSGPCTMVARRGNSTDPRDIPANIRYLEHAVTDEHPSNCQVEDNIHREVPGAHILCDAHKVHGNDEKVRKFVGGTFSALTKFAISTHVAGARAKIRRLARVVVTRRLVRYIGGSPGEAADNYRKNMIQLCLPIQDVETRLT